MAELIEMEKVAGRYQSKHDLMQDIPQSKKEKVDVRDHYEDDKPDHKTGPRMSSNSSAKSKAQTSTVNNNNKTENVFTQENSHAVDVQTKAITTQSKTLDAQTGLMKDQGNKLDDLNVTMEKLYTLLYKEHNKLEPKYQDAPVSTYKARKRPDANGQTNSFGDLASDVMDMFGGKDKKGKKVPKVQTTGGGRLGKLWNGAQAFGSSVAGLGGGGGGPGLGSRVMSGAKEMFSGGGGGWRGKLAKGALAVGAGAVGYKGLESLGGLGAVSEHFESSGKGVGTISTGKGDHGGASYGAHQLSSKSGTMAKFLRSEQGAQYAGQFAGLQPGTPEFNAAYKNVVANDKEGFNAAQSGFIKATHYDPAARKLEKDTGLDVSKRSRALQELVYSNSTQYGPHSSVLKRALAGVDVNSATDEELISKIQDDKEANVQKDFKSSSRDQQQGVANRTQKEKAFLLKILADEKKNPQGVMKGEEKKAVDGNTAAEVAQGKVEAAAIAQAKPEVPTVGVKPMDAADIKSDIALAGEVMDEPTVETKQGLSNTEVAGLGMATAGVAKTGVDAAKGVSAIKAGTSIVEGVGVRGAAKLGAKALGPVASIGMDAYRASEIINDDTLAKQEKERSLAGVGGSMAGAVAGGVIGGTLGSVVPVFGTAVGGIAGSIGGAIVGEEGVKAGMDYVIGTPEERQAKAAQGMHTNSPLLQGEHSTLPSAPVVLPSVKDLMTVPAKQPTEMKLAAEAPKPIEGSTPVAKPNQTVSGVDASMFLAPPMETPKFHNTDMEVLKATTLPVAPGAPSFRKAEAAIMKREMGIAETKTPLTPTTQTSGVENVSQTSQPSSVSPTANVGIGVGVGAQQPANIQTASTDKLANAAQSLADSAAKLASVQPNDGTKTGTPPGSPGMPSIAPVGMSALDAKPLMAAATSLNPFSPASPTFYNSEPAISQRPSMASPVASAPAAPVASAPKPEAASRQPFDTVQNVRMAVDQGGAAPAAPAGGGATAGGGAAGAKGSEKPTLDEFPALISDFGLLFVNTGFL